MNTLQDNRVDIRKLKSGKIRLRFKLSEEAYEILLQAIALTDCKYQNTSMHLIGINFYSFPTKMKKLNVPIEGAKRFLVQLYPDQYKIVRRALDEARAYTNTDTEALILICRYFVNIQIYHTHED